MSDFSKEGLDQAFADILKSTKNIYNDTSLREQFIESMTILLTTKMPKKPVKT